MNFLTEYSAVLLLYHRTRLPRSAGGWLFFFLALGIIILANVPAFQEKFTQDETYKRVIKVIMYVIAFVFIILSGNADDKAGY